MNGLFDNHTHSQYSPDSRMTMEEGVRAAEAAGLGGICFSEHYDLDAPDGNEQYLFDPVAQQEEIERMRTQSKVKILKGAELGVMPYTFERLGNFVKSYPFDSVIASLHFIDGTDPFRGVYYKLYPDEHHGYSNYLEVFFDCVKSLKDFDILGHFDYVARYSPYANHTIKYDDYADIMDAIFKYLIESGKTFEINTKTYRAFKNGTPDLDDRILTRFVELGGEAVAFGSDAHDAFCVARDFSLFAERVARAGIRYQVYYEERKPVFVPLSRR